MFKQLAGWVGVTFGAPPSLEQSNDATALPAPPFSQATAADKSEDPAHIIRELRRQIAEYETLLRVIPIGISIAKDPECRQIASNHHHANLIGHEPTDNTSIDPRAQDPATIRVFRDGEEIGVEELPLHRAIAEKREVLDVECDVLTRRGERLTFVGHAAPLFDEDANVRGAVAAFNNITERKLAEEKLAESEKRHRILALENARLYEESQSALRERDCFVAKVSHELRSPLSAILGWTTILRNEPLSEARLSRALEIIERNAHRQSRHIEDLIDVSRITTTGQLYIERREIDLVSVVEDAVQTLSTMAAQCGVALTPKLSATPIQINGDADRLHQVIWNLVSNAIKFAPGGEVTIETLQLENEAMVRVADTGRGIAPDFLPHVFEQFRQAPEGRALSAHGLGLGLTIVHHIVQLHGGRVVAQSEGVGMGAVFVVTLPLR